MVGELKVTFTQELRSVDNFELIVDDIFSLELLPDESNTAEDLSKLAFTWKVTSLEARSMRLQVDFANPEYISTGLSRDKLKATVVNPKFFFSTESFKEIHAGTTDSIKVVKMMPNTAFTKSFEGITGNVGDATNVSLFGNFLMNLLLSGAMNLLWGFLHALQIVSHFPLVSVMMPANAQLVFAIIIKIATF